MHGEAWSEQTASLPKRASFCRGSHSGKRHGKTDLTSKLFSQKMFDREATQSAATVSIKKLRTSLQRYLGARSVLRQNIALIVSSDYYCRLPFLETAPMFRATI